MICKGYTETNNRFFKYYDAIKPVSYTMHLDTNILYGLSMMQLRPNEILDWVNKKDFNLDNHPNDSPVGCFLEICLNYPDELRNLHKGYHLAGEKKKEFAEKMLPEYQLQILTYNNFSLGKNW